MFDAALEGLFLSGGRLEGGGDKSNVQTPLLSSVESVDSVGESVFELAF